MAIIIRVLSLPYIAVGVLFMIGLFTDKVGKGIELSGPFFLFGGIGMFFLKKLGRRMITYLSAAILGFFTLIGIMTIVSSGRLDRGLIEVLVVVFVIFGLPLFFYYHPKVSEYFK